MAPTRHCASVVPAHRANTTVSGRPLQVSRKRTAQVLGFTGTSGRGDLSSAGSPGVGRLKISWSIPYRCHWGQSLGIVGRGKVMGEWNPTESITMKWNDGDIWRAELEIVCDSRLAPAPNIELEYKYIVKDKRGHAIRWQDGYNTWLRLPSPSAEIVVAETWDTKVETREILVFKDVERVTLTKEEILQLQARESMIDLEQALLMHRTTVDSVDDPSDMEAIVADRVLASAFNKAVAFQRALKCYEDFPQLPKGLWQV